MKKVRISVEFSRTLNLGNYNSARFQAGVSFDVSDDEIDSSGLTIKERFRDAWAIVEDEVEGRLGCLKSTS